MKFELPEFLIKKLENQYGKSISEKIIEGYSKNRKVTFRVNTLKSSSEKILKVLEENNIKYRHVSWSKEAFILESATESEIEKLDIRIDDIRKYGRVSLIFLKKPEQA